MRSSFLSALALFVLIFTSHAQVALTTAGYNQNFDGLAAGLPTGWSINLSASSANLGTPQLFTPAAASWSDTGGSFKNVAAADNPALDSASTSTQQNAATDRALGVRQTGTTGFDPGAAFSFNFSSMGIAVKSIGFSAQMVSVQTRSTTWLLQVGVGANPSSWTTIATYDDPGVFGTTTINVSSSTFGAVLNNQSNAWLRIVALSASTGSGSRDLFAIDDVTIVTAPAPVISTQPTSTIATLGQSASFSVAASGTGTLTYQWRKGTTAINGNASATTSTLTIPTVGWADTGSYNVVVTDENGSSTSSSATLTVTKAAGTVTFTNLTAAYSGSPQQPTVETVPAGRNVSFTFDGSAAAPTTPGSYAVVATMNDPDYAATATGTFTIAKAPATLVLNGLVQTYDGGPHPIAATTSPAGLRVDYTYDGSATPPIGIGSYLATATINDALYQGTLSGTLTIQPAAQTITFAQPADHLVGDAPFTLAAAASSGLPVTFTLVSGSPGVATLAGNVVTLTGATGAVTVRASQAGGGNFAAAAPVDRVFSVVEQLIAPVITVSPAPYTGNIGDRVTLTGAAAGMPAPTYQWQRNATPIPGATSATYTIASATEADSGLYALVATNSAGEAATIPVAVTIGKRAQTITFSVPSGPLPAGTGIPLSAYATSGLPVTLSLVSGAASITGNQITGNGGTVVIRASQPGNDAYAAAETVERTLTFINGGITPFITVTPADQSVLAGTSVSFRAVAVGTPAPEYQWNKDGAPIAGATNGTLTLPAVSLSDAGRYGITATNAVGSASASATLIVRTPPVITASPADVSVPAGTPAVFSVTAVAFPAPSYQWRRNGGAIAGATHASFTIASPRNSDEGQYDVVVTNELGSATSAAAALLVDMKEVTGTYFGRFVGTSGSFALDVRADGTATFVGHLSGLQTGIVAEDVLVDFAGNFSASTTTVAAQPEGAVSPDSGFDAPPRAAAARSVTLRGTLDETTGALAGSIPELGVSLEGTRAARTGRAAAQAGFYRAALLGSADGRGYIVVAPDGQAFVFTASGATLDSASGQLADTGRLRLTTGLQAALDVGFDSGRVSGTVRVPGGTTGSILGASADLARTERLMNLSVRSITAPAAPLIAGFVIGGDTAKQVLIRAAGPAIGTQPFNVPNTLDNPAIRVLRGSTEVATNENWGTPTTNRDAVSAAAARVGAFPFRNNSADAALVRTLAPGPYTVTVSGGTGVVLAEIYEVLEPNEAPAARRLVNLSARGAVIGGSPLIAGFVISGNAPQRVLIRGIGPALGRAPFNLAGALPDPQLTLFQGNNAVKTNNDWFRDADADVTRAAASSVGAFALEGQGLDAAMVVYLPPGAYTAQVSVPANRPNDSGIALVEVYEVAP